MTFSTANQELQDASQHGYYDSGLEESETPSSKSSSGPRIGPLALPEDHYERTTPDGSIGEMEHPENGKGGGPAPSPAPPAAPSITGLLTRVDAQLHTRRHQRAVSAGTSAGVFFNQPTHNPLRRGVHPLRRRVTSQRRNTINMQHNQLPKLLKLTSQLCKSQPVQPSISSTYGPTEGC